MEESDVALSDLVTTVDVSKLSKRGAVVLVHTDEFPNVFIARVKSTRTLGKGTVLVDKKEGEYLVAYSRLCTHMGAHLVTRAHQTGDDENMGTVHDIEDEGVIRCPCHLTCFDLCNRGLVVMGQATARLAQVELGRVSSKKVKLIRWMSPAYGDYSS